MAKFRNNKNYKLKNNYFLFLFIIFFFGSVQTSKGLLSAKIFYYSNTVSYFSNYQPIKILSFKGQSCNDCNRVKKYDTVYKNLFYNQNGYAASVQNINYKALENIPELFGAYYSIFNCFDTVFILAPHILQFYKTVNAFNHLFNPNSNEILIYDQPNFKGHQLVINAEGEYDLTTRKGWNNSISSIQVPNGYFLTLYDVNPNEKVESNFADIGNKRFRSFQIKDFKKLPTTYFHTPASPDYEAGNKIRLINFDKIVSYISVVKLKK